MSTVDTLAGMAGLAGSADGKGSAARFNSPRGLAAYADGIGPAARFSGPVGIRVIENGSIIVADTSNNVIRLLTPADSRRRAARP